MILNVFIKCIFETSFASNESAEFEKRNGVLTDTRKVVKTEKDKKETSKKILDKRHF